MGCGKVAVQFESDVEQVDRLENDVYDRWLAENVVFAHFQDSSANNIVVECIVRGTPILTNRLPALEEYLGVGYPLFFEDLGEVDRILEDEDRILSAHRYLKSVDQRRFTADGFVESIVSSSIYRKLGWKKTSSGGKLATLMNISHL